MNACLNEALQCDIGRVSVGEVLERFPATQGVASVIGLMMLADEQGTLDSGTERITWRTAAGGERHATIQRYEFNQEIQ